MEYKDSIETMMDQKMDMTEQKERKEKKLDMTLKDNTRQDKVDLSQLDSGVYEALSESSLPQNDEDNLPYRRWQRLFPDGYTAELKKTLKIALPMVFVMFFEISVQPLAMVFGGHLGTKELASLGLANSVISVSANVIPIGISMACDTLFSQVYGSMNYNYYGIILQRSVFLFILFVILCWAMFLNSEPLLLMLGQDPTTSKLVARYLLIFMPAVPALGLIKILRSYIVIQGKVQPAIITTCLCFLLSALLNYLFLYQTNLGLDGSALAQVGAYCISCASFVLYIYLSGLYKQTWPGLSWRLFEKWGEFCVLGVNGVLMCALDYWMFEIGIFMAGILGKVELAAQSLVFNLTMLFYCLPAGIAAACNIRIGTSLGADKPDTARQAAYTSLTLIGLITSVLTTLYAALRFELPKLFTSDPEVLSLCSELLPIVAVFNFSSNISIYMRGVFRGTAQLKIGTGIMLFGYYVIALPIGISLMFLTDLKTRGLWIGFAIGLGVDTVIYLWFLLHKIDWPKLATDALERVGSQKSKSLDDRVTEETSLLSSTKEPSEGLPTKVKLNRIAIILVVIHTLAFAIMSRLLT